MKGLVMIVAAICVAIHVAAADVPSDADVRAVGKYVEELTKGDLAQMRQKKLTKEQYADALLGYAADEKKAAAKFALFRDAFKAYAETKSWEKADGVYGAAQAEGGTEYALAVVGYTTIPSAAKELKARIDADRKSYKQIGILKNKLKTTPDDESLCEALGMEYAAVGNWDGALAAFLTAPGEVAKIADWELNKGGAYTASKVAEFWWGYADGKPKAKMEALRLHAAMWYEIAIGEGAYSGNEAKIVQGRIDETKSYGGAAMQDKATLAKQVKELKPITLSLNGKTVIEFVGVPAGEFTMGTDDPKYAHFCQSLMKPHEVIITRPFWLSRYKVTKEVWSAYRKTVLSDYDKVLGGIHVPQLVSYNDAMEFCEWLTKRVRSKLPNGYVVRLPTEAEWEYALFVKDTDADSLYRNWKDNISQISYTARDIKKLYESKGIDTSNLDADWQMPPIEVGKKKPNGLGLYDMLANGKDVMLDTFDDDTFGSRTWLEDRKANANQTGIIYADKETDPLRCYYGKVGARCICRGGGWWFPHPFVKRGEELKGVFETLRLCIGPDLMKEKGYSFKSGKKK